VELEGSLGYALLSILEAKDVGTMQTSFANLVSSTIVVVDNRVELEIVDLGIWAAHCSLRVSNLEPIVLKISVFKFSQRFPIFSLVIPPELTGFKCLL
jgi:hypothetical protein